MDFAIRSQGVPSRAAFDDGQRAKQAVAAYYGQERQGFQVTHFGVRCKRREYFKSVSDILCIKNGLQYF